MQIFLGLGTNIGDKKENLEQACVLLEKEGIKVITRSPIYKTPPYGHIQDQDDFLNQVIEVETDIEATELFHVLKRIENNMGREKVERWGPRLIDLDILFYGDQLIENEFITVPHKDLQNRNFVLKPLCDIATDLLHPVFRKTMRELLDECRDDGQISKIH